MTACATVSDLLELTNNPARLSLDKVRALLGVGTDRARVVRQLAIESVQRKAMAERFPSLNHESEGQSA